MNKFEEDLSCTQLRNQQNKRLPITITKWGEVWFPNIFLLMFHNKPTNRTQRWRHNIWSIEDGRTRKTQMLYFMVVWGFAGVGRSHQWPTKLPANSLGFTNRDRCQFPNANELSNPSLHILFCSALLCSVLCWYGMVLNCKLVVLGLDGYGGNRLCEGSSSSMIARPRF